MTVETKNKSIDELRQSTWLSYKEASQFIGKSEKELKELIEVGYFKLSNEANLIDKESIERYLSKGERFRIQEYQRKLNVNAEAEKKRGILSIEIDNLEKEKIGLLERLKGLKDEINALPVSEVFEDPKFKPYQMKVFKKTINVGGTTFVANDPVTPVAVTLFESFSPVAPIENYIMDASEMKLQPRNGIRA